MSRCRLPELLVLGFLAWAAPALAQNTPDPARLGPSFACPTPRDPLGLLICSSPALSRRDLEFVQTYQALVQQTPPGQLPALRAEAAEFGRAVRTECGVGAAVAVNAPAAALPGAPPVQAAGCVEHGYVRQHDTWVSRLTGPGLQEARRSLPDHLALQHDLQLLGLLPPDEVIDGVYGARTRTAVLAFQQTMGLPQTGLLGDEDAAALVRQVAPARPARTVDTGTPRPATAPRTPWEGFRSEATAMGVNATAELNGTCAATLEVRDPDALRLATLENVRSLGQPAPGDPAKLFAAEVEFFRTRLSARGVQALYGSEPGVDQCRFAAVAFTTDIFGRDVPQPLFGFVVDRATEEKVVWTRFDSANLPRIVQSFSYGSYARERLGIAPAPPEPERPALVPAVAPAPTPVPAAPATPVRRPRRASDGTSASLRDAAVEPGPEVARWSGTSSMITRPFHVDGAWELRWSSAGSFSATLHRMGADGTHLLAMATSKAESSAFQPQGGDYYIEFTGVENWSAAVVTVGN